MSMKSLRLFARARRRPLRAAAALMAGTALASPALFASQASADTRQAASAPTTITFWEAFSGELGTTLQHLVDEFNTS